MDASTIVVPWEHSVCSRCLDNNPYALWLIKEKCLVPQYHRYSQIRVAINSHKSILVKMRPLPSCAHSLRGNFVLCRNVEDCDDSCPYAHSKVEQDTWNFIKKVNEGNSGVIFC